MANSKSMADWIPNRSSYLDILDHFIKNTFICGKSETVDFEETTQVVEK